MTSALACIEQKTEVDEFVVTNKISIHADMHGRLDLWSWYRNNIL